MAAYLARLPRGIDSFPEVTGKASVVRSFIESTPLTDLAFDAVPDPVAQLLRAPPPHSSWVSEVLMMSTLYALVDHRRLSGATIERWLYEQNRKLFDTRMYRALVALAGPSLLMRGTQLRWNAFHRGSTLELVDGTDHGMSLILRFPQWVFDETLLIGFGTGIRAALELSRAPNATVCLVEHTPRSARFQGRWG
jgi:hypothetical protein